MLIFEEMSPFSRKTGPHGCRGRQLDFDGIGPDSLECICLMRTKTHPRAVVPTHARDRRKCMICPRAPTDDPHDESGDSAFISAGSQWGRRIENEEDLGGLVGSAGG